MRHVLTAKQIRDFEKYLILEERSDGTIRKYMRDIHFFCSFLPAAKEFHKETVINYKEFLRKTFAVSTANSMLAAINRLFTFLEWHDCRVKPFKQQRQIFRDKDKELSKAEYLRLLDAARASGNRRLFCLMQTLCGTGIRIYELCFITAEAVKSGEAMVTCKGKSRTVLLTKKLRHALMEYCRNCGISSGPVFITKTGKPMNRSNIWAEMKRLCADAHVDPGKVFPHNFRHLFAVSFYHLEKDIAKLADLLGHASIETTRIYIMESGADHLRQIERLGLVL